jgi:hypothetical protein
LNRRAWWWWCARKRKPEIKTNTASESGITARRSPGPRRPKAEKGNKGTQHDARRARARGGGGRRGRGGLLVPFDLRYNSNGAFKRSWVPPPAPVCCVLPARTLHSTHPPPRATQRGRSSQPAASPAS